MKEAFILDEYYHSFNWTSFVSNFCLPESFTDATQRAETLKTCTEALSACFYSLQVSYSDLQQNMTTLFTDLFPI